MSALFLLLFTCSCGLLTYSSLVVLILSAQCVDYYLPCSAALPHCAADRMRICMHCSYSAADKCSHCVCGHFVFIASVGMHSPACACKFCCAFRACLLSYLYMRNLTAYLASVILCRGIVSPVCRLTHTLHSCCWHINIMPSLSLLCHVVRLCTCAYTLLYCCL